MNPGGIQVIVKNKLITCIVVILICLSLVSSSANFFYHQRVLDRIIHLESDLKQDEERKLIFTTTWLSGGKEYAMTTTRLEGEADAAWAALHKSTLEELQELFPPDSQSK